MLNPFTGTITALITPFTNSSVNFSLMKTLIERQIQNGIKSLVILGTTGEYATCSDEEKRAVFSFVSDNFKGRINLIYGCGSNCTKKAVENAKQARDLGADGLLCVTPYYSKCTDTGLINYYENICNSCNLPLIAYNVPSRTGVNISSEIASIICDIENLVAIKEASGNMKQVLHTIYAVKGKCDVLSGDDLLNLPILLCGGKGVISVISNIYPDKISKMVSYALKGNITDAINVHEKLLKLTDLCFSEVNPVPVKTALSILGYDVGFPRSPLSPLRNENYIKLKEELENLEGVNF